MNSRLATIVEGVKTLTSCCCWVLLKWKVSYMKKIPHPTVEGMIASEWTQVEVEAYTREGAAMKVDPKLRPGYNCWVTRVIGR